jgi:hypothetical protein
MRFHPASALLGLTLAGLVFVLTSQISPSQGGSWPPAKKEIVNVFQQPATAVSVTPGGWHSVYAVPEDRWLTVTVADGGGGPTYWSEYLNGVLTRKGLAQSYNSLTDGGVFPSSPLSAGGPIGWTFRPGSQVVIENASVNLVGVGRCALIGYLSRE